MAHAAFAAEVEHSGGTLCNDVERLEGPGIRQHVRGRVNRVGECSRRQSEVANIPSPPFEARPFKESWMACGEALRTTAENHDPGTQVEALIGVREAFKKPLPDKAGTAGEEKPRAAQLPPKKLVALDRCLQAGSNDFVGGRLDHLSQIEVPGRSRSFPRRTKASVRSAPGRRRSRTCCS